MSKCQDYSYSQCANPPAICCVSDFSSASKAVLFVSLCSTLSIASVSSPTTSCSTCRIEMCDGIFKCPLHTHTASVADFTSSRWQRDHLYKAQDIFYTWTWHEGAWSYPDHFCLPYHNAVQNSSASWHFEAALCIDTSQKYIILPRNSLQYTSWQQSKAIKIF